MANSRYTIKETYELVDKLRGEINTVLSKQADDISSLKEWRSYITGALAFIGLFSTGMAAYVWSKLSG